MPNEAIEMLTRRRSTRHQTSATASALATPPSARQLRSHQRSNVCADSPSIQEEKDEKDESVVEEKQIVPKRTRKGPKENIWKGDVSTSTPISNKSLALSEACELVPVSPSNSTRRGRGSGVQSLTPIKLVTNGVYKSKAAPSTPKRTNEASVDSPMEVEESSEDSNEDTLETTTPGTPASKWKAEVIENGGDTPKLKIHRLNGELELSRSQATRTPAASTSYKGSPATRTPTQRGLKSLSSRKPIRKLDLSTDDSPPAPAPETPTTSSLRRSTRLQNTPSSAYYGDKVVSASSESEYEDSGPDSDESSLAEESSSDEDEVQGNSSTPVRKTNDRLAALLITPKVQRALSKVSAEDCSPRRTPNLDRLKNTPTSESYFTAEKRIKFGTPQSVRKRQEQIKVKEAKTGAKKPRKGNRQGIDKAGRKIPMLPPEFSISKECSQIPLDTPIENPWFLENEEALEKLHNNIVKEFPRWFVYLREGFNIMLHGYGSKKSIFDAFSEYLEGNFPLVVINGLFPKFNPRKFVVDFAQSLGDDSVTVKPSTLYYMTEDLLAKTADKSFDPYFIFVLNFDMLAARHPQMLTALCGLAKLPFVHIIASSDHINAGLGVSPNDHIRLNFLWLDCTTFMEYSHELVWLGDIFGKAGDGAGGKNSLEHIFKSLTANAKKAFGLLAGLQLRQKKSKKNAKNFLGVEFRELLRVCRESFVAHSELVLKSLLTEFIDHKIIHYSGKGKHDDNFLIIDLDDEILDKYAEN